MSFKINIFTFFLQIKQSFLKIGRNGGAVKNSRESDAPVYFQIS